MNTVNHGLWGATLGRAVGLPIEGAIMGALPDISVPVMAYYHKKRGLKEIEEQPTWIALVYKAMHNWWVGLILTAVLFLISPKYSLLGLAFLWHGIEDAFVHIDYATRFLWPVWNKKVRGYRATHHKWIQLVDLILIVIVNLLIFGSL
jgi:hypothetical protein